MPRASATISIERPAKSRRRATSADCGSSLASFVKASSTHSNVSGSGTTARSASDNSNCRLPPPRFAARFFRRLSIRNRRMSLGGPRKKVTLSGERHFSGELKIRLMHQPRGIEGLAGLLLPIRARGETAQLVIDQGQQLGRAVVGRGARQFRHDFAHRLALPFLECGDFPPLFFFGFSTNASKRKRRKSAALQKSNALQQGVHSS